MKPARKKQYSGRHFTVLADSTVVQDHQGTARFQFLLYLKL